MSCRTGVSKTFRTSTLINVGQILEQKLVKNDRFRITGGQTPALAELLASLLRPQLGN